MEEPFLGYYRASARMWNQLRREFLYAAEQVFFLLCTFAGMQLYLPGVVIREYGYTMCMPKPKRSSQEALHSQ